MAVISFMTTKGGSGKTTGSILFSTILAEQGASVCMIDADPNQPLVGWSTEALYPSSLTIIGDVHEDNILDMIEEQSAKHMFVVIDLEGSANLSTGYALTQSDLILIPLQPSKLDANEAAKTLKFILRQEKSSGKTISARAFWARTQAAYITRSTHDIGSQFEEAGIRFLKTSLIEREAFRGIFNYGRTLENLTNQQVPSLKKAKENATSFTNEIISLLKENRT
ncbi:MAG: chromosome partitioning protein [Candidatus Tokpelaia sp. JSC189]|nr:MAG: chromosome partitioning protein [Candidatus Tokpelaia sp. JSC189]